MSSSTAAPAADEAGQRRLSPGVWVALTMQVLVAVLACAVVPPIVLGLSGVSDAPSAYLQVTALTLSLGMTLTGTVAVRLLSSRKGRMPTRLRLLARAASGFSALLPVAYAGAVLFGAPVWNLVGRTFLWAAVQSALFGVPLACVAGSNSETWRRLVAKVELRDLAEVVLVYPALGSVAGSWLGAVPIPLDWDRPWQQWPITCVAGALIGHGVGTLVAAITACRQRVGKGVDNKET